MITVNTTKKDVVRKIQLTILLEGEKDISTFRNGIHRIIYDNNMKQLEPETINVLSQFVNILDGNQ